MEQRALQFAELFPSLGWFGSLDSDCIDLETDGDELVSCVRISIPEKLGATILNLRGARLFLDGQGAVSVPDGIFTQSSEYNSDARHGASSLLSMRGIHSASEVGPWWQVEFLKPQKLSRIKIFNRRDAWGVRSWPLKVEIGCVDKALRTIYDGRSPAAAVRNLADLDRFLGFIEIRPGILGNASELRIAMLDGVLRCLRERSAVGGRDVPWRCIVSLLRLDRGKAWSEAETNLVARFLLAQHESERQTSIHAFSAVLDNRAAILKLQHAVNAAAGELGLGEYVLTRHGLQRSKLRAHAEDYLGHLSEVLEVLSSLEIEGCIGYGTLLGAVRDANFIAHDDDVDVIYRVSGGCAGWEEVGQAQCRLAEELRSRGYGVLQKYPASLNMHVTDKRRGTVIDLFPAWEEGEECLLHMRGMRIEKIDARLMWPVKEVLFLGRYLPAPCDPDGFLEARYGASWCVSDQFFEWPWRLID